MYRHRTAIVPLIFGLALLMLGATFLVRELTDRDFNPAWAASIGLVSLGVVALAVTLFGGRLDEIEAEE